MEKINKYTTIRILTEDVERMNKMKVHQRQPIYEILHNILNKEKK